MVDEENQTIVFAKKEAYDTNDTMRIDSIRGERIPFS